MKKLMVTLLALMMLVSLLAGCTDAPSGDTPESSAPSTDVEGNSSAPTTEEKPIVVLLMAKSTSPYSGAYFQEFKNNAALYPEIEWVAFDAQSDMTLQSQQADEAIAMKPKVIMMQPVDSVAGVAIAKKVHDAGIIFFSVNTELTDDADEYTTCFYGPDFITQGQLLADVVHETFPDGGSFVYLGQESNNECSRLRLQGFVDRAESEGYNFELLAESPACDWQTEKGKAYMSSFLSEFSGQIDFVYAVDDAVGFGAYQAINEDVSGLNDGIRLVSVGGCAANLDAISNDASYLATLWLSPTLEVHGAMEMAAKMCQGVMPENYANNMPIYAITVDNVGEYEAAY